MEYVLQRKYVSEHGQNPWYGIKLRNESNIIKMVEQYGIMKCLKVAELGQVLLNDCTIVSPEHTM